MCISATQIFDFLDQGPVFEIDRQEIASAPFGKLRRSLSSIILQLRQSDDQLGLDVVEGLRPLLSEWLTVPVPFDQSVLESLTELLGPPETVGHRWGKDIQSIYENALQGGEELILLENPMRGRLRAVIEELHAHEKEYKVFCHKRARHHFESLFGADSALLLENSFLNSLSDYREVAPFEFLIKVGPLRTRGWSSVPDALITAPRFHTLKQFIWSGSRDQTDFAYDPVSPFTPEMEQADQTSVTSFRSGSINWTSRVECYGEDPGADSGIGTYDELQLFHDLFQSCEKRAATLVQIDREQAILYPPNSRVVSFDPDPKSRHPIQHRIPGETLTEGMYVVMRLLSEVDIKGNKADFSSSTELWKKQLKDELRSNAGSLIVRLRKAGLNLVHLRSALQRWSEAPEGVIFAPQQFRHFEILIHVLGLSHERWTVPGKGLVPLLQVAWTEIRRSRGEAIQAGFVEKEIVEDRLLEILQDLQSEIRDKAAGHVRFRLEIPTGRDLQGWLIFCPVVAIEDGFQVSETDLRIVHELQTIDKWRD